MTAFTLPDDFYFENYRFSFNKRMLPKHVVYQYLSGESYWARGISIERVERSIDNSICIGIYDIQDSLAGFGRMITDQAVFAYLADIFILEAHRGKGLSKQLVRAFCGLLDQLGLRRTLLATQDAHGLYSQFDFEQLPDPGQFMTRKGASY